MEYAHHGDPLVPRQQRFGLYTRSLMKGLGVPVENRWGLRPARSPETNQVAPLTAMRDLDKRGWLTGVTTFNFHPHLPHYALTTDDTKLVRVLARQPVDMTHPHPFTEAGNREFNTFLWMPPSGTRAGDILLADLTNFTTLVWWHRKSGPFLEQSRHADIKLAALEDGGGARSQVLVTLRRTIQTDRPLRRACALPETTTERQDDARR